MAIIPARGGSKRIPRKNIKLLLDRPIILHVLDMLVKSHLFDEIHVSTEDDEIFKIVSQAGFPPKFKRSGILAGDDVPLSDVTKSVVVEYDRRGVIFDTIALIFATSALIDHLLIKKAVGQFELDNSGIQMLSVTRNPEATGSGMKLGAGNILTYCDQPSFISNDEKYLWNWQETGNFVIYNYDSLLTNSPESMRRGFPIPMDIGIDINTKDDWAKMVKMHNKRVEN